MGLLTDRMAAMSGSGRAIQLLQASLDETAEELGVSADTVRRDWRIAKMWLLAELKHCPAHD